MNRKITIEHLYIEIPNFKKQKSMNTTFSYFIKRIKKELTLATNHYHFKLKIIYLANKSSAILPINFFQQLLILIEPFTINIKEYNVESTINNIDVTTLQLFSQFQINRLVWKIISFQDKLNAKYNYQESINLINSARNLKFSNFSIDLKYNLPYQRWTNINKDLQICIQLQAPHISYDSYNQKQNLTLKKNINTFLQDNNYDNYEYYSYSKNTSYQSQYITAYCLLTNYYGLGPNAVSYIKESNKTMIITNTNSIQNSKQKITYLSENEILVHKLVQGLFLRKGIPINKNDNICQYPIVVKLIENKQLKVKNYHLFSTNDYWLLLNELIIDIITNNTI